MNKPLGHKCYGSIPHLPESRLGSGDHYCEKGQAAIAYGKLRDSDDEVIVLEKLDGTNVGVAKINDTIIPLNRAGYKADTSPYRHHQLFAEWVYYHQNRFSNTLENGERICGEWLLQAHGSIYNCPHEPFVVFDMFSSKNERYTWNYICDRLMGNFVTSSLISRTSKKRQKNIIIKNKETKRIIIRRCRTDLEYILSKLTISGHGCLDPVEGAVWRVERKNKVDFLCKYVRHDKIDGYYLNDTIWNKFVGDEWLKEKL